MMVMLLLVGCGDLMPVPEEAVKACLDKDWVPKYRSQQAGISFTCIPQGQ